MKKELIQKIKLIPSKPGVYLFKDKAGLILYIGKAINLKNRVKSHFKNNDSPVSSSTGRSGLIGQFKQKIATIDYIKTENETQALILEDQLIKKYQPKFNIQQKDDKSYFWINFTDDEWPRVQIIHHLKTKNYQLKTDLVGPLVNGTELKKVLRTLRKIFPYRTCKNSYEKPCLQWHLGLCPAHKNSLSLAAYHQLLNTLKQFLRFYAGEPLRIEAYDISNIQGTNATGSMIAFNGNKPKKSDYRKFKIKTVRGANDVAMLKEILRRRLNHKEWPLPDLMLVDGGRAQLNAVWQIANSLWPVAKNQSPPFAISHSPLAIISLAKKDEEIYTIYSNKTLRLSALPVNLRLTFQAIRNEAHRFAISYYRKLHQKRLKF